MIYTARLCIPTKQAFGNQAVQSTAKAIASRLILDPDETEMDVVILGEKDFESAATAQKLQQAIVKKHPDICVIYIYTKDANKDLCECEYKRHVKKITSKEISDAFMEFVGEHKIRQGKQRVSSADFEVPENDIPDDIPAPAPEPEPVRVKIPVPEPEPEMMEAPVEESEPVQEPHVEDVPPIDTSAFTESEKIPMQSALLNAKTTVSTEYPAEMTSEEAYLAGLQSFEDWAIFKEHLTRESIVKNLISENSEYVGLVNTIDVLDQRIETVFRDQALTPDQKFDKIREIGLEKSVVRAATNSHEVEKVVNIIASIILSAKRTVDDKISNIDTAMYKITTDKSKIADTSYIDKAIEERSKIQLDLLNLSRGIVDLYKSVDSLIDEEIAALDKKLPSANAYINEMVKPIGTELFTPKNTSVLANKLMRALQENTLIASQLEESVNAIIETLFNLCAKDEEIIRYEQNMVNLLKAHRVEDVIITNSLLKKSLHLFVGADNTGRSATAITWSGILSRRQNTLLFDLTGRDKFADYGIEPITLEEFMGNRIEKQFVCVKSDHILGPDEVLDLIEEMKTRLNYYPIINIILAPEDENALTMFSEEALCVHYITDCTTTSIKTMAGVISHHKSSNIARKLICIDAPVSPLSIADAVGADPTMTKVITLPNVPAIRACALRHDRPYEFGDTVVIFEEAFR